MKTLLIVCFLFICNLPVSVNAGQSDLTKNQANVDEKTATDNIFNDIMQSLPENVKNKLDSLKSHPADRSLSVTNKTTTNRLNDQRKSEFSKDLRIKVDKAMEVIDLQQQKRQLQFKESKKRN
jgi:hypothetical protein